MGAARLRRAAAVALVIAGCATFVGASPADRAKAVRIERADAPPTGIYLVGNLLRGALAGAAIPLAASATGQSTLAADGGTLVYEVATSRRIGNVTTGSVALRMHDLGSGADEPAIPGGHDPTYRPDGSLVYLHADFRRGATILDFQPMERRSLRAVATPLGPPVPAAGRLFAAADGFALLESATSTTASQVLSLRAGRTPRDLVPDATRAGVVAVSPTGTEALLWSSSNGRYELDLVRIRDAVPLSRFDTEASDPGTYSGRTIAGAWTADRAVVAFGRELLIMTIQRSSLRRADRLELPFIDTGANPHADVSPIWIRFRDPHGHGIVFATDLASANLGGRTDIELFACRIATARCGRSNVLGDPMMHFAPTVAPVSRAGSGVAATR